MPKYRVTCHEIYYCSYLITAGSEEDAIDEVEDGNGEQLDKDFLNTVDGSYDIEEI